MNLFPNMETNNHEQLLFCHDKESGLKAIIAIHDTTLGPALGGTRMWMYESESAAIEDALRLAKGMTYKNAVAGLNLGGGKAVIIGDPRKDKNEVMLRAFGRHIQGLNGRYITAEDVGTTVSDMNTIYQETEYVTGISPSFGSSGNPSPVTAYGVYWGMKAAAKEALGTESLEGKTIAVQGVGNVAFELCRYLHLEGANLIVTDIHRQAIKKAVDAFNCKTVKPDEIYEVDCDIYAPCALGGTLNDTTIPLLKAKVVAGSANNQLKEEKDGDLLYERAILYTPDFVINAGGVINIADELMGEYNKMRAMRKVESIYATVEDVIAIAKENRISTHMAAINKAEERLSTLKRVKAKYLPNEKHIFRNRGIRY